MVNENTCATDSFSRMSHATRNTNETGQIMCYVVDARCIPPVLRVDQSFGIFVDELDVYYYYFYSSEIKDTFMYNNVCSWTNTCRCQACASF